MSRAVLTSNQHQAKHKWRISQREGFVANLHAVGDKRLENRLRSSRAQSAAQRTPVPSFWPPTRPRSLGPRDTSAEPLCMEQYSTEASFPSGAIVQWNRLQELKQAEASAQDQGHESLAAIDPRAAEQLEQLREGDPRSPLQMQEHSNEQFRCGLAEDWPPVADIERPKTAGEMKEKRSFSKWSHHGMRFRMVAGALEKEDDNHEEEAQLRVWPKRKPASPNVKAAQNVLVFGPEPIEGYVNLCTVVEGSEAKRGSGLAHTLK